MKLGHNYNWMRTFVTLDPNDVKDLLWDKQLEYEDPMTKQSVVITLSKAYHE